MTTLVSVRIILQLLFREPLLGRAQLPPGVEVVPGVAQGLRRPRGRLPVAGSRSDLRRGRGVLDHDDLDRPADERLQLRQVQSVGLQSRADADGVHTLALGVSRYSTRCRV